MKLLVIFSSCFLLFACERNSHQAVVMKNWSSETIYFILSANEEIVDPYEIANLRSMILAPRTLKMRVEEMYEKLERFRIPAGNSAMILSSESAGIFVNAITIKSIIEDRYSGKIHIFIIKERDLKNYPDNEILERKMLRHFTTIMAEGIDKDIFMLEYFE
jgi:hypothetical protein